MPPPSALAIATQAVQRLVKEERYYHKDLAEQQGRVKKLEDELKAANGQDDGNAEYMLKQERQVIAETEKVFGPLRERILDSVRKLQEQIALGESEGVAGAELDKAKEALQLGQEAVGTVEE